MKVYKTKRRKSFKNLAISVGISVGVGLLSSLFTQNAGEFYTQLKLPSFAPPGWIFAPVWTILYVMMGIASYRVWTIGTHFPKVREALRLYGFQLLLNFLWSILFFRFELIGISSLEIFVLLFFIILATTKFYRLDKIAGLLMVPYILWVAFASVLNLSIWFLNR